MLEVSKARWRKRAHGPRAVLERYIEVLALTLALPLVGYLARVPDPFFVHAAFPWLVLVAILVGAEHGLWAASLTAGLWCAGAWGYALATGGSLEGLRSWSIGCCFVALITGWFRDRAELRGQQLSARAEVAEARQQQSARSQRVLQLSHARLEERLLAGGWSLENVLRQAARELGRASTPDSVYAVVLDVIAGQAPIHAASLLRCGAATGREAGRPQLEPAPVACFGQAPAGAAQHPVVQRVLATGQVALLAPERVGTTPEENVVLAAVPLVTSTQRWLGVIAVHELPFIAFSPETFNELLAIAERLADLAVARLVVLEGGAPADLAGRASAEWLSLRERVASLREPESRGRRSPSGVRLKPEEVLARRDDAAPARRGPRHS